MELAGNNEKPYFKDQLLCSMKQRNVSKVKEILKNCKPRTWIDSSQSTLLHYVAKYGNNLISYLVNAGCKVNAQDELGKTPLMLAVEENHESAVKDLLACNADLYVADSQGRSALQLACNSKICRSLRIVEMCIEKVGKQYKNDSEKIANKLIEASCPLYFAMYVKNSAVTKILIDHGFLVNSRDPITGETALHIAAKLTDVKNVKMLVECGADVNSIDRLSKKPFFNLNLISDTDQDFEILKILLDRGVILTSLNCKGEMQARNLTRLGNRCIEQIFEYDVDFMARDMEDNTILHYLAFIKCVNFEKLMGKKFDVSARNKYGKTAVQSACENDNENFVDFLLDNGAKINYPNDNLLKLFCPVEIYERDGRRALIILGKRNPKFVRAFVRHDEGIQFVLKHREKIFDYSLKYHDHMTEFVLALSAMLDASGTPISDDILSIINNHVEHVKPYEAYKRELAIMKDKVVHESVTLFKLLTDDQNKIEVYVRNQNFIVNYDDMKREFSPNSYFTDVLQNRVKKPMLLAKLKNAAMFAICKLMGINVNAGYIIVNNVFSYLDEIDLKNLVKVQC